MSGAADTFQNKFMLIGCLEKAYNRYITRESTELSEFLFEERRNGTDAIGQNIHTDSCDGAFKEPQHCGVPEHRAYFSKNGNQAYSSVSEPEIEMRLSAQFLSNTVVRNHLDKRERKCLRIIMSIVSIVVVCVVAGVLYFFTKVPSKDVLKTESVPVAATEVSRSESVTDFSIRCNFETKSKCGYMIRPTGVTHWIQTTGSLFSRPQFDKTFGAQQGHFMVVSNRQDPKYYLASNLYPQEMELNIAYLISPFEEIQSESCVEFFYYLNGSAVRPNPLSAQLLVYVRRENHTTLVWFDSVNRTINGWLKGWVPVPEGTVRVIFQAKITTTSAIWPGVVALDEVSLKTEPCAWPLECGPNTFRCARSRVCIPVYLQCDGVNDCLDGSDEKNCHGKPDYEIMLVDGDLSYGSIAMFYQGRWIPVCFMNGDEQIASLTCKKLGYHGRYQAMFANYWHTDVIRSMAVICRSYHTHFSQCMKNVLTYFSCDLYQAVVCTNSECFSGEQICPNSNKCVPRQYYCDGIPDCPDAADEQHCGNCSSLQFECVSHECISVSRRCDGIPQCKDASDEYRCECGTSSLTDKIVFKRALYGREASLGQFPWQIYVYLNASKNCGGSIIHPNWVLTAAHCVVAGSGYNIRLGTVDLNDKSPGLEKLVSRIIIHPSRADFVYDIALLYFSTPIVMNEYVRPVCLSSQQFYQKLMAKGPDAECYIIGWGYTQNVVFSVYSPSKLQMTKVHLIDYQECKQTFISISDIQNTTVCVDNSNLGGPACHGDSGGPLVCRNKYGRFQLIGIASFGYKSCTNDYLPSVYQLVYPYLNWVKSVTGVNFTGLDF